MQKFETTEKQKPAEAGFYLKRSKLTDKSGATNHTSGIYSAEVVLCHRLYLNLYHNRTLPQFYSISKVLVLGQCLPVMVIDLS
ncbi:hypothetical protein PHDIMM138B_23995 [Phytobacter diazotrophicus]